MHETGPNGRRNGVSAILFKAGIDYKLVFNVIHDGYKLEVVRVSGLKIASVYIRVHFGVGELVKIVMDKVKAVAKVPVIALGVSIRGTMI